MRRAIRDVAQMFLRLGATAFGGPAAHIALMREECVRRRQWLDDGQFLDLLGATNLIPGPNSTEMAMHIGFLRAGWLGLIVGGACFILPAMGIVIALAWAYVRFGTTPQVGWVLYGVKPVIIAIIVQAFVALAPRAVKGTLTAVVGLAACGLSFCGVHEIALLFAGGIVVLLAPSLPRWGTSSTAVFFLPWLGIPLAATASTAVTLPLLFGTFLKIGAVLYGGGYVLLAFVRTDFVLRFGWLTDQQLLDAVAIGQVTPGPLFTTATFIGYLLAGVPGACWATLGIFLPGFVFVALSNPWIPRLRNAPWASRFLDGVNVAALGLMAAVTVQLAHASLVDLWTIVIALLALGTLLTSRLNATWLVLGGAIIGLLRAVWL